MPLGGVSRRRRRLLQGAGTLLAGIGLGVAAPAISAARRWFAPDGFRGGPAEAPAEAPADQAPGVETGEPYELAGRRIVFTSWHFIRPGTFDYVDAARHAIDLCAAARSHAATMRRVDMPFGIRLVAHPAQRIGPTLERTEPWEPTGVNCCMDFYDDGR